MSELASSLAAIDALIRAGNSRAARAVLEPRVRAPARDSRERARRERVELAALCRRAGVPTWGVRLLNPWVRPGARSPIRALDSEKAEYAASLAQIGGDSEARKLLATVDATANPQALLFGAFARFKRWDYGGALPLLRGYVAHPALAPYARAVGELNLASACVEEGTRDAEPLLARLDDEFGRAGYSLLHGNLALLHAQWLIGRGELGAAALRLDDAARLTRDSVGLDSIYVQKWRAVLGMIRGDANRVARRELAAVRARATASGDSETARDCDFHLAALTGDAHGLRHVYFGTPFRAYRRRVLARLGVDPGDTYDWSPSAGRGGRVVDPTELPAFKPGQVPQRLWSALASDFYRPWTIHSLHAAVFPDRHFHPVASPTNLHQGLRRLRRMWAEHDLPLRIVETRETYRIDIPRGAALRVRRASGVDPLRERLRRIPQATASFTRAEAVEWWGGSDRAANLILREAVGRGLLRCEGRGPTSRYIRIPRRGETEPP